MHRIESTFKKLKENGKKAFISFVTAGDPTLQDTYEIVLEKVKNGVDIVELGVPYSDPIAEGSVIQAANKRALLNNVKLADVFALVKRLRVEIETPIVLLLYFNSIFKFGLAQFFEECSLAGVDGVIIPDLPYEEQEEVRPFAKEFGIDVISMISPTSYERKAKICENATGFLYCVSSLGVTGVRQDFDTNIMEMFSEINKFAQIPTAIGFGISTPKHVLELKKYADGIIIGSAIVKLVEENINKNISQEIGKYIKEIREALDQ